MADLSKEELEVKSKYLDDITKVLAVVRPDDYSSNPDKVKEILKSKGPFIALADARGKSSRSHKITYDSSSSTLEPIYFWILDFMNKLFGGNVKKLVDNFSSTAGSAHFSEMQMKSTRMQDEGMKIMQTIGVLVKGLINLIYDLKDFELRLHIYDVANSEDVAERQQGINSLKQVWMDTVDAKRGNTGIKAMAQQFGYNTLIDGFIAVNSIEEAQKIDLNKRVQQIVIARVGEFLHWKKLSEIELRKRYNIEKVYLKNQINSLRMYSRWAKPYLKAVSELEMKGLDDPAMVKAFNTAIFQLTLLGKNEVKVDDLIYDKVLPDYYSKEKLRKYYSCVLVSFYFRGIPQKAGNQYVFGGRTEMSFNSYVLNEDEMKIFEKMLAESDVNDALKLASGMTDDSIDEIRSDLEHFLGDEAKVLGLGTSVKKEEDEFKVEKSDSFDDVNPFSALFSFKGFKSSKKRSSDSNELKAGEIPKDDDYESVIRGIAKGKADELCYTLFDVYKKAHGMPSHEDPYG
ncbi:hypothetical protein COU61_04700 [Candidatus Pacearchaeota archaeon CG10_big_fil_rev_8_21_14_0_10_35_13]|nr:MAG: hypothetical protein COU61_04700 [Candidatus Pacearchaeota archaeon CG10_big_fil_rev_8_21_14_0_10_35_13]